MRKAESDNNPDIIFRTGRKNNRYYTENEALWDYPVRRREVNAEGYLITDETYTYDGYGNVIKSYDAVDGCVVETAYYEEDDPAAGKVKGEIKSEKVMFG